MLASDVLKKTTKGDCMHFSDKFRNRAFGGTALFSIVFILVLFAGVQLRTALAQDSAVSNDSKGKIAEAKRVFNEDIKKAKKVFDNTIEKAKKEYRAAVAQAKDDANAVKEASSEQAGEIKQASADAIKAAKAKFKSTEKSAKEDWLKAKETAKKKYDETVSRL